MGLRPGLKLVSITGQAQASEGEGWREEALGLGRGCSGEGLRSGGGVFARRKALLRSGWMA